MPSGDDDLRVGRFVIPASELSWTFTTSGGPGGQHANRSNTRAELRYELAAGDVFPADIKARMIERLGDTVTVVVDETRSQWRNRSIARRRLTDMLLEAMKTERPRHPTKPTRASKRRRVESKRHRSETKRLRRRPDPD